MKKLLIILSWAGFTFASHYYAKIFLSGSKYMAIDVLILTTVQMLLALALLFNREVRSFILIQK